MFRDAPYNITYIVMEVPLRESEMAEQEPRNLDLDINCHDGEGRKSLAFMWFKERSKHLCL